MYKRQGKEVVLNVVMVPSTIELQDVEVVARHDKSQPINKLSVTGARTFSTEETFRFAGSLGDPARMVRSFAGVIPVNDSRNDIITVSYTHLDVYKRQVQLCRSMKSRINIWNIRHLRNPFYLITPCI